MQLDKMTWSKIDKFFDEESTQQSLDYATVRLRKQLDEYTNAVSEKFGDYLKDEFRLLFADLVQTEVKKVVTDILLGNTVALEEYNLAPADWGLRGDHYGIRRKIVEDNADIIRNTYIQGLEEQLERTKEMLENARSYR